MIELLEPINGTDRMALLVVSVVMVAATLICVASTGFYYWHKTRKREAATALVHDMLARGLSTDEIERVLTGAGISRHLPTTVESTMP